MVEFVRICVGLVATLSLLAIIAYLLAFIVVMISLIPKPSRRDPIDREFEELLRESRFTHGTRSR
ncbi:hypothetical protein [Ferrimicrobium sp.]|jgi:hypothetical protein|uniref:hypothetical protein n=1 Tax=Ferrimicrobium sp. TaxID=2926050 RepID=UPI00260C816F|nr:hypothetical protein [Ferrimicrobium sp.]MCL5973259.1 hypothetical protein [Actinomycetota bacterium]